MAWPYRALIAALALYAAFHAGRYVAQPAPMTFQLTAIDQRGELWLMAEGLTLAECNSRADVPQGYAATFCEPEQ